MGRLWPEEDCLLAGRFRPVECLKHRRYSETWRAVDTTDGSDVVVKIVASEGMPSAVRLRLEHEATVLGQLDLPSRPVAVGMDGSVMYLAQSYVEGTTLQARLAAGPLSIESALRLGIDVLTALQAVHERGVIHRDVKPANIIVDAEEPMRRAALIDFGLSQSAWLDPSVREEPVGTARYLAPEAAGLVDAEVDERADLYSAGVVLYECLSGQPLFQGATVGEVLRAHAVVEAPPLRAARREVPRALDALVGRLLAKDPSERYQSGLAVLHDLEAIADGMARGVADPPVAIGLADRRRKLTESGFVGRGTELQALQSLVQGDNRRPGIVLVEAESGGGKSRLLEELCLGVDPSVQLLRGQGVDRVAFRPFQILDGVAAGLEALCRDDPGLGGDLAGRMSGWAEAAAAALPSLAPVLGVDMAGAGGPEAYGEARTVGALSALLTALGQTGRRFLIVLDDAQWADALTLKLLEEWPRQPGGGAGSVVLVAAFRSEEVGTDHPLRAVPTVAHLALAPLSQREVAALCESMAGELPEAAVEAVIRLAEGSPFMASAVLRGMVETGILEHGSAGWQVDDEALRTVQTSRRAGVFLARRLEMLAEEAQSLLGAGAVLGKEFDLDLALGLAHLSPESAASGLQEARRRRVVWVDERTGLCTFTHDKLRETMLERLDPSVRRQLHRRAAERLETLEPRPAFELAYHFDAADLAARAFPYAMSAAAEARERHALDVAASQYRIAERGAAERPTADRRAVHEGLGETLSLAGDYPGAEEQLQKALALADGKRSQASLEAKLGEVAFRRGDQLAARNYVETALRDLGRWVPRRQIGFVLGTLWELLIQFLHTLLPWMLGRRSLEGSEETFLAARMYSRLAYIYWFTAGRSPCAWTHLREMNLVERYPPTPELAQAWSEHAPVMTMIPWYRRGIAYARKSYEVRVALGDRWGQGQSLSFYGVILYAASRYAECIEACQEASELLARMGDRWEENTALWHVAFSHYRLGELTQAVETARRVHTRAAAIGDNSSRGIALSGWARAAGGNVPADLVAAALAMDTGDAHTAVEVRVAEGLRLMKGGEWAAACQILSEAVGVVKKAGLRQEYVAPAFAWAATAHRGWAETIPAVAGRERRRAISDARKEAGRALRLARFYRNNLPHALREAGLVAAMAGRDRRARRLLERSLAVAESQKAAHEVQLTLEALASVVPDHPAPAPATGTQAENPANAGRPVTPSSGSLAVTGAFSAAGLEWSLSLADRFSTLLEVGRRITSAPSPTEVYQAVREGSLQLLRGDHCHIIEVTAGGDIGSLSITESGNPLDKISRRLIRRALETGEPVMGGEAMADDSSESLVLSNARSSLCAPIFSEGRPVACLYVVSRHMARLFGEEELRLASFVATLAGASLEHVAGSEARFRSLVQNSSDVITIVDEQGTVTYQSASVTRVFGLDPAAMVGRHVSEWLHPGDVGMVLSEFVRRAPGHAAPSLLKCRVADAGGAWRHVETALTDLRDDPGVGGIVLNTRDVSERVALEAELRHRAWHDVVTGLANRALFTERVEHARARYTRNSSSFAVLFLDLDDFKSVNDTLGHATGDEVLRVVAERLSACVRPEDTVARFGGDEFAVLLEGADLKQAATVCRRLLETLAEPMDVGGHQLEAQASIGVVLSDAAEGAEGLLASADAALYVAKARGKRRFEVFEPAMRAAAVARAGLRNELDHALARSELQLVYQPIVTVGTGQVTGFEALLRWVRPHGAVLTPDHFIPLAEESGAIVAIGAWVLETACRQAREWLDVLGRPLTMAVNVSARQLLHPGFLDDIRHAVHAADLDPSMLVLEITESATVYEGEGVTAKLREVKALGVGLALDDFGTGYSSLSYLRRLPVDILKIDRSFVSGLGRNGEDGAIVQTVVSLARGLGLETVAEGVETLDQLEMLAALGCGKAQGFNWKRPCGPDVITQWMLEGAPPVPEARTRVLIADDSAGLRAALRVALSGDGRFQVVGEAVDGVDTVRQAAAYKPDIILLDLQMPGTGGLQVLPDIRAASPGSQVVILTALDVNELSAEAILAARAVLDKTRDLSDVLDRLAELAPAL